MKTLTILFTLIASLLFVSCTKKSDENADGGAQEKTLYTCGMHPQIIKDKPGDCPICGMALTPIRKQPAAKSAGRKIKFYKSTMNAGETSQSPGKDSMGTDMVPVYEDAATDAGQISIDPVTVQNMGVRTALVTRGPVRRVIRTVGIVAQNETADADVTTKFKGWIEKLDVNATGQQVHKGDTLFEIYSPDLWSAQTEFLLARNQPALRSSALTKLKFFDITDEQVAELEKAGTAQKTLAVKAPITGFVMEKMVVQGQMVEAGQTLYKLSDLSVVWVQSQIYEQDLALVKLGQEATVSLSYLPESKFLGRVTYIYPTVDEKTRTAQVRMEFHNPGFFLKPGMFAKVEIHVELDKSALLVADTAVLRSGEKNTVFVALDGGKFEARTVTLGARAENNMYQVLDGLKEGERVVTSGQFMLDSESQLREALQKMTGPGAAETPAHEHAAEVKPKPGTATDGELFYVCPMPEHISILHTSPGSCPICKMALVPVTQATLKNIHPDGQLDHYTCPMPEHADVHSDKPGKCPRCGMTLIPVMKPAPLPATSNDQGTQATLKNIHPEERLDHYTCPMSEHADVHSDKPGKCPRCGMMLIPVLKPAPLPATSNDHPSHSR